MLFYIGTVELTSVDRTGHRTRERSTHGRRGSALVMGYSAIHVGIDDHARDAWVKQHADEGSESCARLLYRALRRFADLGLAPARAVIRQRQEPPQLGDSA